jgi:hypothetical protein
MLFLQNRGQRLRVAHGSHDFDVMCPQDPGQPVPQQRQVFSDDSTQHLHADHGRAARRTGQRYRAVEGLQPTGHAAQSGTRCHACTAVAVVADHRGQHAVTIAGVDLGLPGAGVVDHAGQALAEREAGGRLGRRRGLAGDPADDRDRDGQVEGERTDRSFETAVSQHRAAGSPA